MAKHAFKKFERSKTPPKFRIGSDEVRLLELLADYRFLDTRQILALRKDLSERTIKRKLQYLYQAGFIDRPKQQFLYFKASNYLVYSIAKRGANLLSQEKGIHIKTAKAKEIGASFLKHALMISEFRACLTAALDKAGAKLAVWRDLGPIDAAAVGGVRQPIAPDAFFTIGDRGDVIHFFLEADRSTMTTKRVLLKLKAYLEWWRQGRQKQLLGISNFRVITLTISDDRKDNLRIAGQQIGDSGQGSSLFWFGCQNSFTLENPSSILQPIWQTSKDEVLHKILE